MTVDEALQAYLYAETVIRESDGDVDTLDGASDLSDVEANCPAGFTAEQKQLTHRILLDAYERVIGRA